MELELREYSLIPEAKEFVPSEDPSIDEHISVAVEVSDVDEEAEELVSNGDHSIDDHSSVAVEVSDVDEIQSNDEEDGELHDTGSDSETNENGPRRTARHRKPNMRLTYDELGKPEYHQVMCISCGLYPIDNWW
ncbi:hypothetical protein DPMN_000191 [Dreissena polymorpha]|uniref:Uncharacterized protein n=1 Tax=Dreissena polymorpha TaxID=45954 RepID=A0A9D4MHJ1_DREPO|nr:hypothetical protein DPMN_000191 [Dreissena polymorpha]